MTLPISESETPFLIWFEQFISDINQWNYSDHEAEAKLLQSLRDQVVEVIENYHQHIGEPNYVIGQCIVLYWLTIQCRNLGIGDVDTGEYSLRNDIFDLLKQNSVATIIIGSVHQDGNLMLGNYGRATIAIDQSHYDQSVDVLTCIFTKLRYECVVDDNVLSLFKAN